VIPDQKYRPHPGNALKTTHPGTKVIRSEKPQAGKVVPDVVRITVIEISLGHARLHLAGHGANQPTQCRARDPGNRGQSRAILARRSVIVPRPGASPLRGRGSRASCRLAVVCPGRRSCGRSASPWTACFCGPRHGNGRLVGARSDRSRITRGGHRSRSIGTSCVVAPKATVALMKLGLEQCLFKPRRCREVQFADYVHPRSVRTAGRPRADERGRNWRSASERIGENQRLGHRDLRVRRTSEVRACCRLLRGRPHNGCPPPFTLLRASNRRTPPGHPSHGSPAPCEALRQGHRSKTPGDALEVVTASV
jgi:hypothetical protein